VRIRVQVSRVDLDGRRIDFRLVRDDAELVMRAMRDKTGSEDVDASARRNGGKKARGAAFPVPGRQPAGATRPSRGSRGARPPGKGSGAGKSRKGKR